MQTKEVIQQVWTVYWDKIRNEQEIKLEELAHKTGVSKINIGKIERGGNKIRH